MKAILITLLASVTMARADIIHVPVDWDNNLPFVGGSLDAFNGTLQLGQTVSIEFDLASPFVAQARRRPMHYGVVVNYVSINGPDVLGTYTTFPDGQTRLLGETFFGFGLFQYQATPFTEVGQSLTSIRFDLPLPVGAPITGATYAFYRGTWVPDNGATSMLLGAALVGLLGFRIMKGRMK